MRHDAKACFATCTARSTSSTDARSTAPLWRPDDGLNTELVRPDEPVTFVPPTQWWMGAIPLPLLSVARTPGAGASSAMSAS